MHYLVCDTEEYLGLTPHAEKFVTPGNAPVPAVADLVLENHRGSGRINRILITGCNPPLKAR